MITDWRRARSCNVQSHYTATGKPMQNDIVQSLNGRFRSSTSTSPAPGRRTSHHQEEQIPAIARALTGLRHSREPHGCLASIVPC
ncbi:integrase core domain-containing protein [Mesorhizobium sp. M0213]|uniref:integrase core domain-containing protein n=1 Tax=Mesorhizobium sp. M0213 TaxID=2956917 RepID=UPI00333620C8